jgi:CubicO group peptidase (beta-lactamase class C family)
VATARIIAASPSIEPCVQSTETAEFDHPIARIAFVAVTSQSHRQVFGLLGLLVAASLAQAAAHSPGAAMSAMKNAGFKSATSVHETRRQIERLPQDDIWWTVNGPDMAWNFRNLQRIYPTVPVYRDGPVREVPTALDERIVTAVVDTKAGQMTFGSLLASDHSTTMGLVIAHRGRIVFERYPRMQPYEKPIYWSVTKVVVSALIGILEDEGKIDTSKPIDRYLPALQDSSFKGILVQNILDMATGIDCGEEYVDKDSCYYRYSVTVGDGHFTKSSPADPYAFVASLNAPSIAPQGTRFAYSGLNTFVLAWLVESVSGMPLNDAVSARLWTRLGAESDAMFLAPRFGVPNAHGGLMARMRDVLRFGLLFTPSYSVVSDYRIISERYVQALLQDGRPELMRNAHRGKSAPGVRHNINQWDVIFDNNDMFKGGWAGQGLLVNPERDLVAVFTGYFKSDHSEVGVLAPLRDILSRLFPHRPGQPGNAAP